MNLRAADVSRIGLERSSMRRSIALLVSATAVLFASFVVASAVAPAASASGARSTRAETAPAVPTDAVGIAPAESPTLALNLDAGASEEHDVVVSNRTSNLRLTVRLAATDATGAPGTGAGMWLAFGTNVVELDPHASVTIPMTIAVPHDTQPGSALAHAVVTVESAVAVADGSPRRGIVQASLPISVQVTGASTAQIAVADVQRVDHGSQHQLAMVLRNFGAQGAAVHGTVRVGGDHPQMLPFNAELVAGGDTTVQVPWRAPPVGTGVDLAIEVDYDGGNTASWSSTLGGPPLTTSGSVPADVTPTTVSTADPAPAPAPATTATRPWWNSTIAKVLAAIAVLLAALWFLAEFGRSRRRRPLDLAEYPFITAPAGWVPDSAGTSVLSERIVTLTEAIVDLAERRDETRPFAAPPDRAGSPGALDSLGPADHEVRAPEPTTSDPPSPADGHGPAPPARAMIDAEDAWAAAIVAALASEVDETPSARSASPTPSDVARPVAGPVVAGPVVAASSAASGEARSAAELWAANEAEAEVRREALRIADEKHAAEKREQELIAAKNAEERRAAEQLEADRRAAEAAEVARREAENARLAKEFQEAEERRAAEWRAAEVRRQEERRAAELAAQEAQRAAEWRAAEDRRIEEGLAAQRAAEAVRLAEAERRAEERAAVRRAEEREAEERRAEMRRAIEERNAAERERRAEERRVADEERRLAAEERRAEERRIEEERRAERRRAEEREAEERLAALERRRAEEHAAKERAAAERALAERVAAIARDRRAAEMAAEKRALEERVAHEQLSERVSERVVAESAAAERIAEEIRAAERLAEQTEERLRAEREAAERMEAERRADRAAERVAQERIAAEGAAADQLAEERRAERLAERAAQDRLAADRAAQERIAAERLARERFAETVALRAAAENLALERLAEEQAALERLTRVQGALVERADASYVDREAPRPSESPAPVARAGAGIRSDPGEGSSRPPDTDRTEVADVADPGQTGDGRTAALVRLAELERARRQMKSWMDEGEEVAEARWVPEDALLRLVGSAEQPPPSDEG